MGISQWWILVFGVSAIWLATETDERRRRWAPVCGCLGQPAWIVAALETHQTGVLIISLIYAAIWMRGLWLSWGSFIRERWT